MPSLLDLLRRLRTPQRRSELFAELRYGRDLIQPHTFTLPSRYPALFAQCALLLARTDAPRILSFGCSTGEEAFSLHRLIPRATILGVDLNNWCLRQATRQNRSPSLTFVHADSAAYASAAPFHAIFCMAVFQQASNREEAQLENGFTFARFEQALADLDRLLLPGGYLFIDNCDFLFTDTALAAGYSPVEFPGSRKFRKRPLFDRTNRRIAEEYTADRCFRKHSASC